MDAYDTTHSHFPTPPDHESGKPGEYRGREIFDYVASVQLTLMLRRGRPLGRWSKAARRYIRAKDGC